MSTVKPFIFPTKPVLPTVSWSMPAPFLCLMEPKLLEMLLAPLSNLPPLYLAYNPFNKSYCF